MAEFLVRLRLLCRRLANRCPPKLKPLGGPLLGGVIGLIGGIPGFFIGVLMGYLLRELFVQCVRNRKFLDYFENPGFGQFYEQEPGLAAWCALAVLVSPEDDPQCPPSSLTAERILKQIILEASCLFTFARANTLLAEHFSRMALSVRDRLNQDLLAESLVSRRVSLNAKNAPQDLRAMGQALRRLAAGEKSRRLAQEICLIIDPSFVRGQEPEPGAPGDPWKILGLSPGASQHEIKSHYRRLAKLFHPDELEVLDEQRRETAARAFMAIKEAYQEIMIKA